MPFRCGRMVTMLPFGFEFHFVALHVFCLLLESEREDHILASPRSPAQPHMKGVGGFLVWGAGALRTALNVSSVLVR